jgi:hypothetical protein
VKWFRRVPIWTGWGVTIAALCAFGYWVPQLFVARENVAVEWALRLPKERERARIAGFVGEKRIAPNFDPAKDAGVDWVRIDAEMRADALEGELPRAGDLLEYASPRSRAEADLAEVRKLQKAYAKFLPDAERATRKLLCYFPNNPGDGEAEGMHAAAFVASLHFSFAVDERKHGRDRDAMKSILAGIRIARQLQAQNSVFGFSAGSRIELVGMRLIEEGVTVKGKQRRADAMTLFAAYKDEILHPHEEPPPATRLHELIQDDYLLTRERVHKHRAEKYKPEKKPFSESVPLLRLLNRLDFVLGHRLAADAWESTSDRAYAGLAVRLRGREGERRPYVFWKAIDGWDRHAVRATAEAPKWLKPNKWTYLPLRLVLLDTERALTQAIWDELSSTDSVKVPDDPFAPKPNTPLRRRELPDGTIVWYSIGANGKDDGGDPAKDRVAKIPPLTKD